MNEFVNGIILVLFGGIKVFCMIAEAFMLAVFVTIFAIYLMVEIVLCIIEDGCDCIMHHKKPTDFFKRPRTLLHLVKDGFIFGSNYTD